MVRIRFCEQSLVEPILNGDVRCPPHLYSGEEAIAAGVCAALSKDDYVFGTQRSHVLTAQEDGADTLPDSELLDRATHLN